VDRLLAAPGKWVMSLDSVGSVLDVEMMDEIRRLPTVKEWLMSHRE
jgi:hypothetical protein